MVPKGIPTAIRIGGLIWDIQYHIPERMGDNLGLCRCTEGVIEIRQDQSAFELRDTVLHEVLHAMMHHQGRTGSGPADEETHVRCTATGLMGVLQDNPLFAKWLITPINKPVLT